MAYKRSYSRNRYSSSGSSRRFYSGSSPRSYSPTRTSSSRRRFSGSSSRSYRPTRSRFSYGTSARRTGVSTRTKNGYSQFYDRRSGSWKFTHRRVAEKKLGGSIRPGYEVHHKNHNKRDNRPSNLTVLSKSAHRAVHRNGGLKSLFKRWRK